MNITSVTKHLDEDGTAFFMSVIDGKNLCVPDDPANRHYAAILRQVEAGTLVVAAAE
tara:strand:- start:161 stop:331 length:171 start_codon:yes stop_codon:yes gene_type:complete